VTDYAFDDPDSSYCAHANSVLRGDRDSAAAVTAALLPITHNVGDDISAARGDRPRTKYVPDEVRCKYSDFKCRPRTFRDFFLVSN